MDASLKDDKMSRRGNSKIFLKMEYLKLSKMAGRCCSCLFGDFGTRLSCKDWIGRMCELSRGGSGKHINWVFASADEEDRQFLD